MYLKRNISEGRRFHRQTFSFLHIADNIVIHVMLFCMKKPPGLVPWLMHAIIKTSISASTTILYALNIVMFDCT